MANSLWLEGMQKYVGFCWTLPVPSVGFLKLSDDPNIAAKQSKTIKYQRELIRKWVTEEGQRFLIKEIMFLETQSDRGTNSVEHYVQKAAKICRENNATLMYIDFSQLRGWRPHPHLLRALEREQIRAMPILPSDEPIIIDGRPFYPPHHFKNHRLNYEREAARRYEVAIERLLAADKEIPPCSERNGAIANKLNEAGVQTSQGRPWTADNVKKTLQRLQAKR